MQRPLEAYIWVKTLIWSLTTRDESGEGVISTAIAVLIMAALGAVMWVGFQAIWGDVSDKTSEQINQIGSGGP